ncbi:MAG: CDP-diacylglycerol--serine O-phosphatidyltransferase [Gemmatales bacterium]|nr:CDP-diacylglycerol--serine O-phosphatidyltransferase [Gemmatales bacterium]MCS7160688.1 CDP-diacylglycerol--serine O-phosphatidyltransferase [Gemmatales bacterium]MDW8175889.1 CDP-diacylglycerol--serine O-phosphatidyltransferase [Gemmatales bacterium]MDW8223342.1 CDP-diacylglycerol--serine O-phosphatidyltransferase [Gemmatales bacterium]
MRRIAILPTLCTLGNAACGFTAIMLATGAGLASDWPNESALYTAAWLIFAAMVFDVFDGFLARRSRTASQFGAELDSLCDAISFGAAPGFLLLQLGSHFTNRLAGEIFLLIALLYMVCAVLRLARFNVQTTLEAKSHKSFQGLPSPAAAGCLASLVLLGYSPMRYPWLPDEVRQAVHWFAPLGATVVALLMVSRISYPHLAMHWLRRRRPFTEVVEVIFAVFLLVFLKEVALLGLCWLYVVAGPALSLVRRKVPQTLEASASPIIER